MNLTLIFTSRRRRPVYVTAVNSTATTITIKPASAATNTVASDIVSFNGENRSVDSSTAVIYFVDLGGSGRGGELDIAAVEGIFVVVHPDFENVFVNSDLMAELSNIVFVAFLHLPPDSVGELVHLLFLKLAELGPEPLTRSGLVGPGES